jgi:hypothetical protein
MAFGSELTKANSEANATSEKEEKDGIAAKVVTENQEMRVDFKAVFAPLKMDDTVFCTHVRC